MNRVIIFFYLCFLAPSVTAQNYVSAAPWDNSLSFNPAIAGLTTNESIQMNLYSRKTSPVDITPGLSLAPLDFDNTINFERELPDLVDIKNSYFLGYHKSIPILERFKLTVGIQLQHSKRNRPVSQDNTGTGLSFNVHFIKKITPIISRNWSFGYQLNILLQTPNLGVTSYAYNLLSNPILSLDEYNAQFRKTGTNHTLSANYTYIRKKETVLNFGFVFSSNQFPIARNTSAEMTGRVNFSSFPENIPRLYFEWQQDIINFFVIQFNALFSKQNQIAYGFGFRLGKHNLFKVLLINAPILESLATNNSYSAANLSLDYKRFRYSITLGLDSINFAKFGVVYRLAERDTGSLLSFGN